MQHFALNHIEDWEQYETNQGIIFEVVGTQRRLQFSVIAEMETRVYAYNISRETGEVETRSKRLLGVAKGLFTVDVRVSQDTLVEFHSDSPVHVRQTDRNQTVAKTDAAPFTTDDPGRIVPKEMDIVLNMIMQNQNRLEKVLNQEREQNHKEREEREREKASKPITPEVPKKVVDDSKGGQKPKKKEAPTGDQTPPEDVSGGDGDDE